MQFVPDTNIFIYVADQYRDYRQRFAGLSLAGLAMSAITAAELEASIHAEPADSARREASTRPLLASVTQIPFMADAASAYGYIIQHCGYNRRKAIDRMIAAQALTLGATLITANPSDFREIPNLVLEDWSS
jgi:predicted nucleic acid-binding protein